MSSQWSFYVCQLHLVTFGGNNLASHFRGPICTWRIPSCLKSRKKIIYEDSIFLYTNPIHLRIPTCNIQNYVWILPIMHFNINIRNNKFTYPSLVSSLTQDFFWFRLRAMKAIKIRKDRKMQKPIKKPLFWGVARVLLFGKFPSFTENMRVPFIIFSKMTFEVY